MNLQQAIETAKKFLVVSVFELTVTFKPYTLATINSLDVESLRVLIDHAENSGELYADLATQKEIIDGLVKLTMLIDEHPDDYDGPCFCKQCQQYAMEGS